MKQSWMDEAARAAEAQRNVAEARRAVAEMDRRLAGRARRARTRLAAIERERRTILAGTA